MFDLFREVKVETTPEFTYDFLGGRTRVYFNANWAPAAGTVKPKPRASWEWIPLMWAVATAGDSVRLVELGAGWGPWIQRGYLAARQLGASDIKVVGVEGEPAHYEYLCRHMDDNGIPPSDRRLIRGVVSSTSGFAMFPVADRPDTEWGLRRVLDEQATTDALLEHIGAQPAPGEEGLYVIPKRPGRYAIQRSVSIAEILAPYEKVDYIHFDIQGAEWAAISSSIGDLNEKARIMAVGTHSAENEEHLRNLLPTGGWELAFETKMGRLETGRLVDGNQVWRNSRLTSSS